MDTDPLANSLETDTPDPSDLGQPDFALRLSSPAEQETPETLIARGEIPDGYTRDPKTKEVRRKKRGGRPRILTASPRPETPIERGTDEPPDSKAKGKRETPTPRYVKGVIATGMTKLYQRTGRIIKALDKDIGTAVIESAADCGEAWDELARTNPRVRKFLLKLIGGGAIGAIIMAHAPILLAIVMKDGIRKHIPFMSLFNSVLSDDDDGSAGDISSLLGGINPGDMQQMMAMAQGMAAGMGQRVANGGNND